METNATLKKLVRSAIFIERSTSEICQLRRSDIRSASAALTELGDLFLRRHSIKMPLLTELNKNLSMFAVYKHCVAPRLKIKTS